MKRISILLLVSLFFIFGCAEKEEVKTEKAEEEAAEVVPPEVAEKEISKEPIVREKNPIVVMETNHGTIEIELYWKESPKTAENFLRLVISGFYDGLTFHRVVPNFVIQGGDPLGNGTGGPGYSIPDEPTTKKHVRSALGMAKSGPNTAGSQFYICLRDTPHLDKDFTVFAHVIKGMEVVDKIAQVPTGPRDMPKEKVVMTKVYEKTE